MQFNTRSEPDQFNAKLSESPITLVERKLDQTTHETDPGQVAAEANRLLQAEAHSSFPGGYNAPSFRERHALGFGDNNTSKQLRTQESANQSTIAPGDKWKEDPGFRPISPEYNGFNSLSTERSVVDFQRPTAWLMRADTLSLSAAGMFLSHKSPLLSASLMGGLASISAYNDTRNLLNSDTLVDKGKYGLALGADAAILTGAGITLAKALGVGKLAVPGVLICAAGIGARAAVDLIENRSCR